MLDLKQIESFYPEGLRTFKRNLLREYLQYKILEAIFTSSFNDRLSFMGGTAIHIVHSSARFSEDLDFDNLGLSKKDFEQLAKVIQKKLNLEGYRAEARNSFGQAARTHIRIPGILYEFGLSGHAEEKVLIHVDMQPQNFKYAQDKVVLNKFDVFTRINVVPVDLLLAQKIYAIFARKRPMGRDFYDAIFLFGKTKPNYDYLRLKLKIKGIRDLREKLLERCEKLDLSQLVADVQPFLFEYEDAKKILLFPEYISKL